MPNPHCAAYCNACLFGLVKENDTSADELDELMGFKLAKASLKMHQINEQDGPAIRQVKDMVQEFAGMLFEEMKPDDYDSAEDEEENEEGEGAKDEDDDA